MLGEKSAAMRTLLVDIVGVGVTLTVSEVSPPRAPSTIFAYLSASSTRAGFCAKEKPLVEETPSLAGVAVLGENSARFQCKLPEKFN